MASWSVAIAASIRLAAAAPNGAPGADVVGGHDAPAGKWPDVAAIYVGDIPLCSGVLVAPTVVLTAAHCNTSGIRRVLVGAETLAAGNQGESIDVVGRFEYPEWDSSFDLLALTLARPSVKPPRALASGWAGADVIDGAQVEVVGFGAINEDGNEYIDPLQEATMSITDAACVRADGCNPDIRPNGELGAGGMGTDSCSGDSGGPLYITGSLGTFVAGLTSRSYDGATKACSQGGIYTRADKVADWIEEQTGVPILRGPEPKIPRIEVAVGRGAKVQIDANDPLSSSHRYKIFGAPVRSTASVSADGELRVCGTGDGAGEGRVTVEITDRADPARVILVSVPIAILDGTDDGSCELDEGGCGCRSGLGSGGALPLALALLALRRRRRRSR
ncbi:MAG: serine protease [Kofleriaceae bacterium]